MFFYTRWLIWYIQLHVFIVEIASMEEGMLPSGEQETTR